MDTNWLTLGGNELVNTARVQAYAVGCGGGSIGCACPGLAQAVEGDGFGGYTDPVVDDAPWIDPAVPASGEFLGVLGLEAEGLGNGTMARSPVELAQHGANIGVPRFGHREITYEVSLVARTEAGLAYGTAWLASALRGTSCGEGECWGAVACVFAWCPTSHADGDAAQRYLYDVGLLEGPETTQVFRTDTGLWFRSVEFTLVAGNPHIYTAPYIQLGPSEGVRDVVRVPPGGLIAECEDALGCAYDPDCPPPPLPPLPPAPVDPCWPQTGFQAQRTMFSVPPGGVSAWFETVPVVRIESGGAPLRRVSVRFYANPTGADCGRFTDRCLACGEANLAYIPAGAVLTMDGRRKRTVMDCSGGRGLAVSEPVPFGSGGGLFAWPEIDCASGLCVEVLWERQGAAEDARIEIEMAARQEAV